jgi:hypothetical protein
VIQSLSSSSLAPLIRCSTFALVEAPSPPIAISLSLSLSLSLCVVLLFSLQQNFFSFVDLFSRSGTTFSEDYLVEKVGIFFPFFSALAFGFSSHGRLLHRARERCVYREVERF